MPLTCCLVSFLCICVLTTSCVFHGLKAYLWLPISLFSWCWEWNLGFRACYTISLTHVLFWYKTLLNSSYLLKLSLNSLSTLKCFLFPSPLSFPHSQIQLPVLWAIPWLFPLPKAHFKLCFARSFMGLDCKDPLSLIPGTPITINKAAYTLGS